MHYDVIIIGGGLSGLSAGIRLSYFGKRVAVFERHAFPGGMNGYYFRDGHCIDAGLHAMTNIAPDGVRSAPLNQVLRQLRIKRSDLEIAPQKHSIISFPSAKLILDNCFDSLKSQIRELFPCDTPGFQEVCDFVETNAYTQNIPKKKSSRAFLEKHLSSPVLREMLLFPTMFYGSATPDDMDLQIFCNIFRSIFFEGLGRPADGMRPFIQRLVERFRENGGDLFLANGISQIRCDSSKVSSVIDDRGVEHTAELFISSIGAVETSMLFSMAAPPMQSAHQGQMAFIEGIFGLSRAPAYFGLDASIIFKNSADDFLFRPPDTLYSTRSCLLCAPGNFAICKDDFSAKSVKVSLLASPSLWFTLDEDDYRKAKQDAKAAMFDILEKVAPGIASCVEFYELFTPKTIQRFTGHINGAIYGSPDKCRDFRTECPNLFLCGTDQELYGIVGALISGNVLANSICR